MTSIVICKTSDEYFAEPVTPGRVWLRGWNGKTGRLMITLPNLNNGGIHVRLPSVPHPDGYPSWEIQKGISETGEISSDLTVTPSIDCQGTNRWHGWLTDGVLRDC